MLNRKKHTRPHSPLTTRPPSARHALFWQSAPAVPARCSSRRRMRVRAKVTGPGGIVDQTKPPPLPKRPRFQNCTHVTMDRVYGRDKQCFVCGQAPATGYLYECRENCGPLTPRHHLLKRRGGASKSTLRCELEEAGLSESVVSAAEQGHYTDHQLKQLVTQKNDLKQLVEDAAQCDQINDAIAKLSALTQAATTNDGAPSGKSDDPVSKSLQRRKSYQRLHELTILSWKSVGFEPAIPVDRTTEIASSCRLLLSSRPTSHL
jgi:hypothetical protein